MGEVIPFPTNTDRHAERLATLSARARDTGSANVHAIRARNAAIIEAVDDGHPQKRVADWCGLRPSSITRILALPSYGADESSDDLAA